MNSKSESLEALPYYRWYWRDWRANRKVQRMAWQARALYRELLDEFWAEGSIPTDLDALADICGCTRAEMEAFWPQIEPCWERIEKGYRNAKLESQRTAKDAERIAKANSGRKGGLACNSRTRAEDSEALAKQTEASAKDVQAQPDIAVAVAKAGAIAEAEQEQILMSPSAPSSELFLKAWNENRESLPRVSKLSLDREKKLSARVKAGLTVEQFTQCVQIATRTPFLRGENPSKWKCDFDWLIRKEENLLKVFEGKYGEPDAPKRAWRDVTDTPEAATWLLGGSANA